MISENIFCFYVMIFSECKNMRGKDCSSCGKKGKCGKFSDWEACDSWTKDCDISPPCDCCEDTCEIRPDCYCCDEEDVRPPCDCCEEECDIQPPCCCRPCDCDDSSSSSSSDSCSSSSSSSSCPSSSSSSSCPSSSSSSDSCPSSSSSSSCTSSSSKSGSTKRFRINVEDSCFVIRGKKCPDLNVDVNSTYVFKAEYDVTKYDFVFKTRSGRLVSAQGTFTGEKLKEYISYQCRKTRTKGGRIVFKK